MAEVLVTNKRAFIRDLGPHNYLVRQDPQVVTIVDIGRTYNTIQALLRVDVSLSGNSSNWYGQDQFQTTLTFNRLVGGSGCDRLAIIRTVQVNKLRFGPESLKEYLIAKEEHFINLLFDPDKHSEQSSLRGITREANFKRLIVDLVDVLTGAQDQIESDLVRRQTLGKGESC